MKSLGLGREGELLLLVLGCLDTEYRHLVSNPHRYIFFYCHGYFFKEADVINSFTRLICAYPLGTRCSLTKVDFPAANECNHNC